MVFEKLCLERSLVRCLYHPSASCSACSKNKSKQGHEEGGLSSHGHAILLIKVENDRRHDKNHGS